MIFTVKETVFLLQTHVEFELPSQCPRPQPALIKLTKFANGETQFTRCEKTYSLTITHKILIKKRSLELVWTMVAQKSNQKARSGQKSHQSLGKVHTKF